MVTNPRRSERIQKKASNCAKEAAAVIGDAKSTATTERTKRRKTEDTSATQASTRAVRPYGAHVKGRRGYLKLMTEMPLDILHEIFGELDPLDLLHLSWASKDLHASTMGKSARYIWEKAFEKLYASKDPPPRCPEDLNLAQYASLLFTKRCMQCQTLARCCWSSWELRFRVCWNCLQSEHFTTVSSGYPCLPVIRARNKRFSLTRDYHRSTRCRVKCMHKQNQINTKVKGYHSFEKWEEKRKSEQLNKSRLGRRAAIFKKLAEVGWTKSEVRNITGGRIANLPGFARTKKLTEKDWDVLQPQLVKHLQELKTAKENPNVPLSWTTYKKLFV